jgi:hypothetical protein
MISLLPLLTQRRVTHNHWTYQLPGGLGSYQSRDPAIGTYETTNDAGVGISISTHQERISQCLAQGRPPAQVMESIGEGDAHIACLGVCIG